MENWELVDLKKKMNQPIFFSENAFKSVSKSMGQPVQGKALQNGDGGLIFYLLHGKQWGGWIEYT